MGVPRSLVTAYRAAHYVVFDEERPAVLHIGERCAALDELLEQENAWSAAFVTAFNPGGLPRHESENVEAFGRLCEDVNATPYAVYLGEGRDPKGEWPPEASLLVVGISRADAESLGRRFGQNAIVFVERGGAPELVLLA